ncbi:hypothetical protein B0H14DRAFT_3784053 [Mycena olivaceomarginata]|nr:hypothetical protein B0H14DRAFT_3784053 [Mycena olivaceomarginata]
MVVGLSMRFSSSSLVVVGHPHLHPPQSPHFEVYQRLCFRYGPRALGTQLPYTPTPPSVRAGVQAVSTYTPWPSPWPSPPFDNGHDSDSVIAVLVPRCQQSSIYHRVVLSLVFRSRQRERVHSPVAHDYSDGDADSEGARHASDGEYMQSPSLNPRKCTRSASPTGFRCVVLPTRTDNIIPSRSGSPLPPSPNVLTEANTKPVLGLARLRGMSQDRGGTATVLSPGVSLVQLVNSARGLLDSPCPLSSSHCSRSSNPRRFPCTRSKWSNNNQTSLGIELFSVHSRKTSFSTSNSSHSPSTSHSSPFLSPHRPNLLISLPNSTPSPIHPNECSVHSLEKEIMRLQEVLKERRDQAVNMSMEIESLQRTHSDVLVALEAKEHENSLMDSLERTVAEHALKLEVLQVQLDEVLQAHKDTKERHETELQERVLQAIEGSSQSQQEHEAALAKLAAELQQCELESKNAREQHEKELQQHALPPRPLSLLTLITEAPLLDAPNPHEQPRPRRPQAQCHMALTPIRTCSRVRCPYAGAGAVRVRVQVRVRAVAQVVVGVVVRGVVVRIRLGGTTAAPRPRTGAVDRACSSTRSNSILSIPILLLSHRLL